MRLANMSGNQKFIKLQADQVFLFWDIIKHGVIQAYGIPQEHRQSFAVKYLEKLLTGLSQAWIGFEEEEDKKKISGVVSTKIIQEEDYGVRILMIDALYGFRLISKELLDVAITAFESYAKANNCDAIVAEYSLKRVGDMLAHMGFEEHRTISKKVLTK